MSTAVTIEQALHFKASSLLYAVRREPAVDPDAAHQHRNSDLRIECLDPL